MNLTLQVFAVVVNLFRKQKEELEAFEEAQRQAAQNTQTNLQRLNQERLDGLAQAYAKANEEALALLSTADRLAAAHRQWVDANLQWNLSILDKEEQAALAGAVGDSRAQEDIKAHYAAQRALALRLARWTRRRTPPLVVEALSRCLKASSPTTISPRSNPASSTSHPRS